MKIILSRKGFDSASGGVPSPIINGKPISIPIPATRGTTTYSSIGLGGIVESITKCRISRDQLCHQDPLFVNGDCIFGQCGAAQSHLANNDVSPGDVFLFFGLFSDEKTGYRHHRIFGYLKIETICLVNKMNKDDYETLQILNHPHAEENRFANNTVYRGEGRKALLASDELRLTHTDGPLSSWVVPTWLKERGLTYHSSAERWPEPGRLNLVARGQEVICNVREDDRAKNWLNKILGMISE